jgi:uncharacterized repeat protein (TIGR01451 family)
VLTNAVVGPPESNCDLGTEPECSIVVPERSLEIVKTAAPTAEVLPGGEVAYTVIVTNTGQVPYTALTLATFTDDLTAVLDDATFNDDADATTGEVTFTSPDLTWSGALAPSESATITYSLTVNDPPTGDGVLTNAVVGPPESNCDVGTEPECSIDVPVRALEIIKTSDPAEALAGGTVDYTITVTNTGQVPYTALNPATFTDDLTAVLDDADFNDDAAADIGTVTFTTPTLSWSGALAPGETATITYSVTIHDPPDGDGVLINAVVGPDESNCDTGTEEDCTIVVPVRALEIVKTSDPVDQVLPDGTVSYTVTVTNTGRVAYTELDPATFTDDLTDVLDDATFNDDAVANAGTVAFVEPELSWSGALAPGGAATITYSVTIHDPPDGDGVLTNAVIGPPESNCDTATEEDCTTDVPVRALEIVKTSSPIAVLPGGTVSYTVTATNTGQVAYTELDPATFTDDLTDVLDDAVFNNDATADIGEVTFTAPNLSWSGALEPGAIATITYSVAVNDPATGNGGLTNAVVGPPESNCDTGTELRCRTFVPIRELLIEKTASVEETSPGDGVTYTIVVSNIGDFPIFGLVPAELDDDLTAVLDDATFNDDAAADVGEVSYAEPVLHWESTEVFVPGATATITYSVTVNDPPSGDGSLNNVVNGGSTSNCDPTVEGFPAEECQAVVPVRALQILKTSVPTESVLPGGTVSYTVTVTNSGQVAYTDAAPATFTDDLTAVLDDAVFNNDATADIGEATFTAPNLSWSGALEPGDVATITYSVTVSDPISGDGELTNAVVGPSESNCDEGTEEGCTTDVPVRQLLIDKVSSPAVAEPGGTVSYTVTVQNTGAIAYTAADPATITDDFTGVLDDATYNNDAAADIGTVTVAPPTLTWAGPLAPGQTATITYSFTVDNPDTGNRVLVNDVTGPPEGNCSCTTETPVTVVDLAIDKAVSPATASVGGRVTYTLTVRNLGPDAATGVVVTDPLPPQVSYVSDTCGGTNTPPWTWRIGDLATGATATCSIVVTVAASGEITNTATVTANETETTTSNNRDGAALQGVARNLPRTGSSFTTTAVTIGVLMAGMGVVLLLTARWIRRRPRVAEK